MPLRHALLALLVGGESYGYELRAEFEGSIGPQWGGLNVGHVYQLLDRLVRDGLVTKQEVMQQARPDKVVYRLTRRGWRELEAWLESPAVRQGGYRDDLFLKLFAASRLGQEALGAALRKQREADLSELASLAALRRAHHDEPLIELLIEAAVLDVEAKLRVVDLAEARRDALVEAAAAKRVPQATIDAEKRGRRSAG
jgi:DNA-binding PadR family transcriptional regulator